jgi:hypothetical protein
MARERSKNGPQRHTCSHFATPAAVLIAAALSGLTGTSRAAENDSSPMDHGFSLAALGGYGADVSPETEQDRWASPPTSSPNPFGPALGLRAAYTFRPGLVTAASVAHHFGGVGSPSPPSITSAMIEAGFHLVSDPLVIEPFVGFGYSVQRTSIGLCNIATGECVSSTSSYGGASASAGLTISVPIGDRFFVGGRAQILGMVGPTAGFTVFASAGVRL